MLGGLLAGGAQRSVPLRMQAIRSSMETANAPVQDNERSWSSFVNGAPQIKCDPQSAPLNSARALAPPGSARAARLAVSSRLASTVSGRAGVVHPSTNFVQNWSKGSSGHSLAPPGSARATRLASTDATATIGVVRSIAGPSIKVSGYGMSLSGYSRVLPENPIQPETLIDGPGIDGMLPENDARAFVDGVVQPTDS